MTTSIIPAATVSPLRQRLIADMTIRRFSAETQRNYLRDVGRLARSSGARPTRLVPKIYAVSRSRFRRLASACRR